MEKTVSGSSGHIHSGLYQLEILRRYDAVDINVYAASLFSHPDDDQRTGSSELSFKMDIYELPPLTRLEIMNNLRREMIEIFNGRNIY